MAGTIKIVASGPTNTVPTTANFFYTLTAAVTTAGLTVTKSQFKTDTGGTAAAIMTKTGTKGYYQLFFNGAQQPTGVIKSVSSGKLILSATSALDYLSGATLQLRVTNFAGTTTVKG